MDDSGDLTSPGGLTVPAEGLAWSFVRASGPGGQNVNKRSTRVTLEVDLRLLAGPDAMVERVRRVLGEALTISSQDTRSQWRNRQDCLRRAADRLDAAATIHRRRRPSTPTRGSIERRLAAKRRQSDKKLGRRDAGW